MLREPMLLCTDAQGSAYQEIEKLRLLRENGMSVPEVLYEAEDYFVMEYVGQNLDDILRGVSDEGQRNEYIVRALGKLRGLHEKNFVHGGAQIKNFTRLDGEIYMIDFEEVIPSGYLDVFKLRDIMVFLMSLESAGLSPDPARICSAYDAQRGRSIYKELERTFLRYRFLKFLDSKIFSWIRMNDMRASVSLIRKAERIRSLGE
jgi:tRNA A-37 threonylcarbamoyl transferase component Bud32